MASLQPSDDHDAVKRRVTVPGVFVRQSGSGVLFCISGTLIWLPGAHVYGWADGLITVAEWLAHDRGLDNTGLRPSELTNVFGTVFGDARVAAGHAAYRRARGR